MHPIKDQKVKGEASPGMYSHCQDANILQDIVRLCWVAINSTRHIMRCGALAAHSELFPTAMAKIDS